MRPWSRVGPRGRDGTLGIPSLPGIPFGSCARELPSLVPALEPRSALEPSWIAGAFRAAAWALLLLPPVPAAGLGMGQGPLAATPAPPQLPPASQILFLFAYWAHSLPTTVADPAAPGGACPRSLAMPKSAEHPSRPSCPVSLISRDSRRTTFGKHGTNRQPVSLIHPGPWLGNAKGHPRRDSNPHLHPRAQQRWPRATAGGS